MKPSSKTPTQRVRRTRERLIIQPDPRQTSFLNERTPVIKFTEPDCNCPLHRGQKTQTASGFMGELTIQLPGDHFEVLATKAIDRHLAGGAR